MTMTPSPRRLVYGLLLTVALGSAAGRLLSTQLVYEPSVHRDEKDPKDTRRVWPKSRPKPMPTFGSNDRSRWATVRALVDEGTFVIGRRKAGPTRDSGIIFEDGWQSVDKVMHPERHEFYSSKPPFLATLFAGLYWLLQQLFGWTLTGNPDAVVRTILFLVNVLPFGLYLHQMARLAERFGSSDWGRYFVVAAAGFGTLVTPFLITLNNHTVATYCVLFTMVSVLEVWQRVCLPSPRGGEGSGVRGQANVSWRYFAAAGFFSTFAVCNELPALALAAAVFVLLLWWSPGKTAAFFLPAAALPVAFFFLTNYLAVGQLRPVNSEFDSPNSWYLYEGSHWRKALDQKNPSGIDFARFKENRPTYAFHLLLGHHGLFSLTPLWLLSLGTMIGGTVRLKNIVGAGFQPVHSDKLETCPHKDQNVGQVANLPNGEAGWQPAPPGLPWFIAPLTLGLTMVVVGFYLFKSDNYGGWTVGPRWLMWLTPLWLLCLVPAADRLATSRSGRWLGYACLALSILSACYSPWNPWRHPWIYDMMVACGWEGY